MSYEEDTDYSDNYNFQTSSASIRDFNDTHFEIKNECSNVNIETLEEFSKDTLNSLITIKVYNSNTQTFSSGSCITFEQFLAFFNDAGNWMSLYSKPKDTRRDSLVGEGTYPLDKLVMKLPTNNVYISVKSTDKIIYNKSFPVVLYAVPMFEGKRRRIGNIVGMIGASMNHGQIPGELIYKLYTKSEMKSLDNVKTDYDEFYMKPDKLAQLKKEVSKSINQFNIDFSTPNKLRGEHNSASNGAYYEDPETVENHLGTVDNEEYVEEFAKKLIPLLDSIKDIKDLHEELQWFIQDISDGKDYETLLDIAKYLSNSVQDHTQQVPQKYSIVLYTIKTHLDNFIKKFDTQI